MKYYKLSYSAEPKIIGKAGYPQCKGVPDGYNFRLFEKPNSITKLTNEYFPLLEPELIFELEKKAFLTDVVSPSNISAKGFLINRRVKEILDSFNLMEHKYYPASLIANGIKYEYYWLHFKEDEEIYLGGIDYKNSTFIVTDLAFTKIDDISINSSEDFWKKKMGLPMKHIRAVSLKPLSQLKEKKLGLFYIPYIHSDFMASEELCSAIISSKISGFEIKEQSII